MPDGTNGGVRQTLSALFEAAYTTAHPATCLPPHLPPVPPGGRIIVIGAGKASAAMAVAAEDHYIAAGQADKISGLISTRHGFGLPTRIIEILEAGHPVPDANSIAAPNARSNSPKARGRTTWCSVCFQAARRRSGRRLRPASASKPNRR